MNVHWLVGPLLVFLLTGCTTVIRMDAGQCIVLDSSKQVITAGHGCDVKRVWK